MTLMNSLCAAVGLLNRPRLNSDTVAHNAPSQGVWGIKKRVVIN